VILLHYKIVEAFFVSWQLARCGIRDAMQGSSGGSKKMKKGKPIFISPVVIYRKCTQRIVCLLHGKGGFKKFWANRGRRPPPSPTALWICHYKI